MSVCGETIRFRWNDARRDGRRIMSEEVIFSKGSQSRTQRMRTSDEVCDNNK
jgi:hypothetical protein